MSQASYSYSESFRAVTEFTADFVTELRVSFPLCLILNGLRTGNVYFRFVRFYISPFTDLLI